ncbi:MAG: hypothetical protein Ct9H300mP21_09580 [Pseudomonadota bacterium]|nr:MAG: hypothetical protein Ct9H300mP21_09580 [Pseudomonadota bacterium]
MPPNGIVRVSPTPYESGKNCVFALSKLDWIRKQRLKIQVRCVKKPFWENINQETHYFKGQAIN